MDRWEQLCSRMPAFAGNYTITSGPDSFHAIIRLGLQFTQTFPAEVFASALLNLLIVYLLLFAFRVKAAPIVFLH